MPTNYASQADTALHPHTTPIDQEKNPFSWQVLWHLNSPLTGQRWAELPVHSIVPTAHLIAEQDWTAANQRLTAHGLARYGFPGALSAGHALAMARARWQSEGPHAAWFTFLAKEAPLIEVSDVPSSQPLTTDADDHRLPHFTVADLWEIANDRRTTSPSGDPLP